MKAMTLCSVAYYLLTRCHGWRYAVEGLATSIQRKSRPIVTRLFIDRQWSVGNMQIDFRSRSLRSEIV